MRYERVVGNRTEIAWTKVVDDVKHDVRARRAGDGWDFASRVGRGNQWQPLARPALEDWLQLLDGVRRRVGRHRKQPEDERQLLRVIREHFPGVEIE
jgi:hypothetical protein